MSDNPKEISELWLDALKENAALRREIISKDARIADLEVELRWALTGDMPERATVRENVTP